MPHIEPFIADNAEYCWDSAPPIKTESHVFSLVNRLIAEHSSSYGLIGQEIQIFGVLSLSLTEGVPKSRTGTWKRGCGDTTSGKITLTENPPIIIIPQKW